MALPRSYTLDPGGGYHFDLGDGGPPVFAAGPEADQVAAQLPPPAQMQFPVIPPEMAAAAAPPDDMRTADAADVIRNALTPQANPGASQGIMLPEQQIVSKAPPQRVVLPPQQIGGPTLQRGVVPVIESGAGGSGTALPSDRHPNGDADRIAAALGLTVGHNPLDLGQTPRALAAAERETEAVQPRNRPVDELQPRATGSPATAEASLGPHVVGYRKEGAYVPHSKVTEGTPVSDEVRSQLSQATAEQMKAAVDSAEVGRQHATDEYAARKGYEDELKRQQLGEQQRETQRQEEIGAQMQKAKALADEARNGTIDEDKIWEKKSEPLAAIAMMLGGLQQGALGLSENPIMSQVNKMIDRNIATQEKNATGKRAAAAEQQNLVGLMRQQHGDERSTNLAARGAMLASLEGQLATESAKYKGTTAEINARSAIATLQKEQALLTAKLDQSVTERVSSRYLPAGPIVAGGVTSKTEENARHYVEFLDEKGITPALADLEGLRKIADKYQGSDTIPGYGWTADLADKLPGGRRLLSEEGRINRGIVDRGILGYRKAITGSGGSAEEMHKIEDAFKGAETPAELSAAVRQADNVLRHRLNSVTSGTDPAAVALARSRGLYVPPAPPPSSLRRRGE